MSAGSSSRRGLQREEAIRRVLCDVARMRAAGESFTLSGIVAAHEELLPELSTELSKLEQISEALSDADNAQYVLAWERLEADSQWRREIGSETDDFDLAVDTARRDTDLRTTIGRYQVLGLLGEGGFARVYHAKDEELQRDVAIKVPHGCRGTDPREMEAYWAEARIVAALDHPAIVPVYDVGRTRDGHCYVVSKLIRGEDLASRVKRSRLGTGEAIRIVLEVAGALQYAHERGLVHRDIKPANILLDALGRPFVVDFGLALTECDSHHGNSFAGTPGYMSPEQARGEAHRVDARSDIFSLGVVLYELLTGQKPFRAEAYEVLLEEILWQDPVPVRQWNDTVSEELERICAKAMSKRAADRYESADQLIEDLRHCDPRHEAGAGGDEQAADNAGSARRVAQGPKIIPRGLRSFDANDADFYLSLVPGPRSRTGLPECIRQWKSRIEDPDPGGTFPVGLIYGPSGCGKSSLVRAGLLPRLSPRVRSIYVQASGDDTEQRIQHRLAHQFADVVDGQDLAGSFAKLRMGQGLGKNERLLIVIDQFEQWLHGRGEKERRELLSALRQCDGQHVMCLLLVRDDFWLAVGRFMAELEIELVPGFNSSLVDLFDLKHARRVLAEFGRAYGQLPDDLNSLDAGQQLFLQRAIHGMADEDRIIPVRLALFAEMVKDRPWNPATLRDVGGTDGVGVAFLDGTFSSRAANPRYRIHQQAVRSVLGALLPERGIDIRGRICTSGELLDISGYGKKPQEFKELMRILDVETHLLTPMDLDAIDTHDLKTSPGHLYYQLTHDYLVPSLREWLTAKQKSTRSGRLELRLAERARLWNERPERRQLPSLWEYVSIRAFTRRPRWSPPQTRLMQAATRHHLRMLTLIAGLLATLLLVGGVATDWLGVVLMKLRARSSVAWMVIGREEAIWPLLRSSDNPTERTEVIHGFSPVVTSPEQVLREMALQQDVGIRRSMVLIAGELAGEPEEQSERSSSLRRDSPLVVMLRRLYRDDPDPGLHAAARWTLRRFQDSRDLASIDDELISDGPEGERRWFVNSMGHTMVIVPGWTSFLMGAEPTDSDRTSDESQHSAQIGRSFCISSQETTARQFELFLRETGGRQVTPDARLVRGERTESDLLQPSVYVTWFQAAAYCNWLSEREGLGEDQWCYLPNEAGQYDEGMKLASDFQKRRGYRLPTEKEWEFACRAGTVTKRFFGSEDTWLGAYAVCDRSQAEGVEPVCRRKPNDLGLFDMLGNAAEWCQDEFHTEFHTEGRADQSRAMIVSTDVPRVVRGGGATDPGGRVRSAFRDQASPSAQRATLGFRVVCGNIPE